MDIALAIDRLIPAAKYRGSVTANTEESYNTIRWNDARPKPTFEELLNVWVIIEAELQAQQAKIDARLADIATNLPPWKEIADEYETLILDAQTAKDTENVKALATSIIRTLRRLKKLERVVYWLAKDSQL